MRPSVVCAFDYAFVVPLVESEASGVVACQTRHSGPPLSASTCFNGNRLLGKLAQVSSCALDSKPG